MPNFKPHEPEKTPGPTEPPTRRNGGPGAFPADPTEALERLAGVLVARRERSAARDAKRGKRAQAPRCGAPCRSYGRIGRRAAETPFCRASAAGCMWHGPRAGGAT